MRLIDANALKDRFKLRLDWLKLDVHDEYTKGLYHGCDYDMALIDEQPTVDAVEVADMREFAEDVVYQFGYYCQNGGRLHITHGGLSTLEHAFDILGWENPNPVPECECEIEGCHEHATCGTPTADGYKRVCGKHFRSLRAKMDGDGNGTA
jgi:hypothetical protein